MNQIFNYMSQHPYGTLIGTAYVLICAINAMAPVGTDGGGFYGWAYRFGHLLTSSPIAAGIEGKINNLPLTKTVTTIQNPATTTTSSNSTVVSTTTAPPQEAKV